MELLKICIYCNKEKDISEFGVSNRHKQGFRNECKACRSYKRKVKGTELTLQQTKMKKAVDLLGGECSICKIKHNQENTIIFDFHHINPSTKERNISHLKTYKWNRIEEELKKCILLCSNCHRLLHKNIREL